MVIDQIVKIKRRTISNESRHRANAENTEKRAEKLADKDSNLDKQNQNLLCYRYTIGQYEARER